MEEGSSACRFPGNVAQFAGREPSNALLLEEGRWLKLGRAEGEEGHGQGLGERYPPTESQEKIHG